MTDLKTRFTFNEAVEFTGISRNYLYRLTARKAIKHYKPSGRKIFFMREDLEKFLMQGVVPTVEQMSKTDVNKGGENV